MSTITVQDIAEEAKKLNPFNANDGACVYTTEDGKHCIAAQILVNLGREVPAYESKWNSRSFDSEMLEPYRYGIEPDAVALLQSMQTLADRYINPEEAEEIGAVKVGYDDYRYKWGFVVEKVLGGQV